jgi:iron complex outermembrane receptor protein
MLSRRPWLLLVATLAASTARADEDEEDEHPEYQTVVTSATPLHGSGLPREMFPANVQTVGPAAIAASRSRDLPELLAGELGSVHLNQVQGNPLQADLQYRGFVASPVLGVPQGLSVYLDGVRLNEPFGDALNWDLIPAGALRAVNLMPGSNPLFGLNTLGGAISLASKDGFTSPELHLEGSAGSFGRRGLALELGAHRGPFAGFLAGELFAEHGWRVASSSAASRLFGVLSHLHGPSRVDLSGLVASTRLDGNGPAPVQLLARDRRAVFTYPDRTSNRLLSTTLRAEHLMGSWRVSGTGYLRSSNSDTVNGDQATEPGATFDAALNRTSTRQLGYGATLQTAWVRAFGARHRENHLFAGLSMDLARVRFASASQAATLSPDRQAVPTGMVDPDAAVDLRTFTRNLGIFASDTFSLRRDLFLTVSGRFHHARLTLDDLLADALDGRHAFARFNPAGGLSWQPHPAFGAFAGYSESARAPTPLELSCANPAEPCRLPNGFVSDPPLAQVVARTFEAGVRGRVERGRTAVDYSAAVFRTITSHDLLFVSAGPVTNQGFFDDVGRTRRQGLELGLEGRRALGDRGAALAWSAHYTLLDATFRSSFLARSPNHPRAVDGVLPVPVGARLPSVPRHVASASVTGALRDRLSLTATLVVNGAQRLRGDEANLLSPVGAYALVDLRATWRIWRALSLFGQVRNLLDARYASFGTLGAPGPVLGPDFTDPRFEGPGAPRGFWLGIEVRRSMIPADRSM